MAYCEESDLLIGDIPVPTYLKKDDYIQAAADEIDSHLGFIYKTPINVSEDGPLVRPARLLLKRIAAHLASGRLIMAQDSSGQNEELHQYGLYLVNQAMEAIQAIKSGQVKLEGALPAEGEKQSASVPLISNLDPVSNVEAFYGMVTSRDPFANPRPILYG
jgi:hypothetical protein